MYYIGIDEMNCSDVDKLMSAYYDRELAESLERTLTDHFESCTRCTAELTYFRSLSAAVAKLPCPPPPNLWSKIEAQLRVDRSVERKRPSWPGGTKWLGTPIHRFAAVIAATVLVATWLGYSAWLAHRQHTEVAHDFSYYISQLQKNPAAAREYFAVKYAGLPFDRNKDLNQIAYRPAVAAGLPTGYRLVSSDVLNMPCCRCVGSLTKREDGSMLAIFEHDTEQPHWFGDLPSIDADCSGQATRIVEFEPDLLAATWQLNNRYLTVIGVRDIKEISQLVSHFKTAAREL